MADIVLWPFAFFGAKPKMIVKGGLVNWGIMGDPNASLPTPEPVYYRPLFGSFGLAMPRTSVTLMSKAAVDLGVPARLGLQRQIHAVGRTRAIGKRDMVRNSTLAKITIDPETYVVKIDGEIATCEPASKLPLAQSYYCV